MLLRRKGLGYTGVHRGVAADGGVHHAISIALVSLLGQLEVGYPRHRAALASCFDFAMASNIRTRLPCVSGSEQTIASALLGSQPCMEPEASPVGSGTYIASGDSRMIVGSVSTTYTGRIEKVDAGSASTTFTGPIGKVDAYFTGPPGVDTHQQALTWLGSTSHSTVHKKAWKSQEPETGLWFLNGGTFRRWLTEPSSLIWLHGGGK